MVAVLQAPPLQERSGTRTRAYLEALVAFSAVIVCLLPRAVVAAEDSLPAILIAQGSVASQQVVALGRDLEVAGETLRGAAVVSGDARITGTIGGDLIVLGGSAALGPESHVFGDAFVLGGALDLEPGARVGGRIASYPRASAWWIVLLEGPVLGLSPFSAAVIGAKTALLAAWLAVGLVLLASSPLALASTGLEVHRAPLRCFYVGLVAVLSLSVTVVFLSAFASALVGVPFLFLVVIGAVVLKLWGTAAVLVLAGSQLLERWKRVPIDPLYALLAGVLFLGVLKYVPGLGTVVWTAVTLVGVGATLLTKFGRREPWFEPA